MQEFTYKIEGDFSSIRALEIKDELIELSRTCSHLTIDLTQVSKYDIGSINALMMCHKSISTHGGSLVLTTSHKGNPALDELLHVTKFNRVLNINHTIQA